MRKLLPLIIAAVLSAVACGPRQNGTSSAPETPAKAQYRPFRVCEVPSIYSDGADITAYMLEHYWDDYFAGSGVTDTLAVNGVPQKEVESAFADFTVLLENSPMADAQKAMGRLFDSISAVQDRDTSSLQYLILTEMVAGYLYDPNSPMRNEDYFLPFVSRLAESPHTDSARRIGYRRQAQLCAMNPYGSVAPDFVFKDVRGRRHRLSDLEDGYVLLFFSNPGCEACKEIINEIEASGFAEAAIAQGTLSVVSIYIDEEVDKWKAYEPNYPRSWVTGYDPNLIIRDDLLYNVRAIPSLYLLAPGRKVLLKDAPTDKALSTLRNKLKP